MTFEIQRGSEDSANVEELGFVVSTTGLENNLLKFKLSFDSPLSISQGSSKDKMVATIVDGNFFSNSDDGLPVEPGTTIEQPLPKMYPGEEFEA